MTDPRIVSALREVVEAVRTLNISCGGGVYHPRAACCNADVREAKAKQHLDEATAALAALLRGAP